MAIIELVHIKLLGGISISHPSLRQNMQKVTQVIEAYNHLRNLFYVEVEDPSILYVIGAWESQEQHQSGFNGSAAQGQILELVKDQMDIDWMHYIDVEQSKIPISPPVLEIRKYTLPSNADKQAFNNTLTAERVTLDTYTEGTTGGWNLPKSEGEKAVWVQFSGYKSVDDHVNAATDSPALQSLAEKIDVKHATRVYLP